MFSWKRAWETPLTEAVINNDVSKVLSLKEDPSKLIEKNSLGFNGVELARYLDRKECCEILSPTPEKTFTVKKKHEEKVSVLTKEELQDFFGFTYLPFLKFASYKFFKKVVRDTSAIYYQRVEGLKNVTADVLEKHRSSPEIFTLTWQAYREKIEQAFVAPHVIEWIDDTVGYGVFAGKDMEKGEYIAEYTGEVRRSAFWLLQNTYSILYVSSGFFSYHVDGKVFGNETRFINHSFDPNLEVRAASQHGLIHALYFTNQPVAKGSQLTWDYGEDFWSEREPPQDF